MQRQWKCPTCGAMNTGDGPRCRLCRLMPIPSTAVSSAPPLPPSSPYVPYAAPPPMPAAPPMPPPPQGPPTTFLPPPGGWQAPMEPTAPSMLPPPPMYPPPPPGWYPGAPVPSRRQRRVWPIVVGIVVPVLVLIGAGILFLRGADPHAVADRDQAEKALLTNHDLGGSFSEVEHRAFARARGGLRVTGGLAECSASNAVLEKDGQAMVDSVLQSLNGVSNQVVGQEIIVMGSPESATPMVDVLTATARQCVSAGIEAGANANGVSVSLSPSAAPILGDRAAAFEGSMGVAGGQLAARVELVIVQQGRAVLMLLVVDTTGSLHDERLVSLANTILMRLAPRFGT